MAESSVFKICPKCGQSMAVDVQACPSCGTTFSREDGGDFVAYERLTDPVSDETMTYTPVSGDSYSISGGQSAEYQYGENSYTLVEPEREDPDYGGSAPPPMGGRQTGPEEDRSRPGMVVTAIAAVLLIAVVAAGVIMAFRLGLVGQQETTDPMTMALEAIEQGNYADAIDQLEQMLQEGNGTVETYQLLAQAYTAAGNPEGAAEAYLRGFEDLGESTLRRSAQDAYLKLGDEAAAMISEYGKEAYGEQLFFLIER